MTTIGVREKAPSIGEEPERRGGERSEAPRSGGSSPIERADALVVPDSEVSAIRRSASAALSRGASHPPDDVATEDVEDHIEIEVGPRGRPEELGDVPAPDFVGARGEQLGRGVVGPPHLIAPFFDFVGGVEQTIHGAGRADIGALVEQRGMDLRGGLIDKPRVQQIQDLLTPPRGDGLDTPRRGADPRPDTPARSQSTSRPVRPRSSIGLVARHGFQRDLQERGNFFFENRSRLPLSAAAW